MSSSAITGPILSDVRRSPSGSAAAPSWSFADATGTGVYLASTDVLALSTAGVQRVVVDAAGNVGIGTDSPSNVLDLRRGAGVGVAVTLSANGNAPASGNFEISQAGDNSCYVWNRSNNIIAFGTNNTERMRIDASGNVDLGPTTFTNPTYKGKVRLWGGGRNTAGGIEFAATSFQYGFGFRIINPDDGSGSTPLVFQARSNSTTWTTNAFTLYNNGNYAFAGSNVSDERLKEDIQDVENQLQNVLALTPKTFRFKKQQEEDGSVQEPGRIQHGFIAQEVKAILPKLVTGAETNPDEYMGVDYMGLTSVLVKAVQELSAKVDAQAEEIAALKAKP